MEGKVIGDFYKRHRHQEFLGFCVVLIASFQATRLHLVMDNYGTHGMPR